MGRTFRENWYTNLKTKQKYQEVLQKETKSTPTIFSKNGPPFRGGPLASSSFGRGGGGRAPQAFFVRTMPQTQRQHGKSNKNTLPQHSTTSGCRQVKSSSFGQKPFPCQREAGSSGRKTKVLFRKLGKINSRCEYFVHCAGFQNSFLPNPISVWSSPISKGEPRRKVTNKFRNKVNVEERCNSTDEIRTGKFLDNLFLLNKKDGGHRPVINLKFLNSFIPYQHFKIQGMHLIKDLLQEHDFLIKIDLKDAYFGISLDKRSRKYILFQWEGNLYEFLCLCFGLGPAPLIFTKLLKIAIALLTRIKKYNIFRRHASDGPNVEINFASKGDIDFSVTKFRFCDKFKKLTTNTSEGIRVFGISNKFSKHDVSLASGKSFGYPKQVRATSSVTKDHNYGINQTPKETLVHYPGSASRKNSVQVLATTTISGSKRSKFLSNQSKIKPAVTGRVEVVEGEYTSSERQTTENRNTTVNNPNGCFQNRLGAVCQETTTGGNWYKTYQNISIYWSSLQ